MESLQNFVNNREFSIMISAFISGALMCFFIRYSFVNFYAISLTKGLTLKKKNNMMATRHERLYLNIMRAASLLLTALPLVAMFKWLAQLLAIKMAPVGYILHEKITTGIPSSAEAGLLGVLGGNSFTDIYSDYGYMIIANQLVEVVFWLVVFYFFLGRFLVFSAEQKAFEIELSNNKKADKEAKKEIKSAIRNKSVKKWIMLIFVVFSLLYILTAIYYITLGIINPSEVVPKELTEYLKSL